MRMYLVGGAVRDALLGKAVVDHDWVVVGATPAQMLAAGFLPVGRDFPVFLHPTTREEYALARTERKVGKGYHGFVFHAEESVTLEADLARRDLTINAMAVPAEDVPEWEADIRCDPERTVMQIIDPFDGRGDVQRKLLRHVGEAFREDPVRILRIARFAAALPDFRIAPETGNILAEMVRGGEADHLVAERVWQELARGLMQPKPSRMLDVLHRCGALAIVLPELDRLWGVPQCPVAHPEGDVGTHVGMVLDDSATQGCSLEVRLACLLHDVGKGSTPVRALPHHPGHEERAKELIEAVSRRWKLPARCRELALVVAREHGAIHRCRALDAGALVGLLARIDAFRRPQRLEEVLQACACDARGRQGHAAQPYPQGEWLRNVYSAASAVDARAIALQAQPQGGEHVGTLLHQARVQAVEAWLHANAAAGAEDGVVQDIGREGKETA
ncbi:multifunctional CCA addition/repair protein [Candidatus Symbiobacter mobilis]|uniref:tRNA nucleotidyltransferase n=1 Tax=Candidatus Symbiobacter mobilis CR TaxID=946483 RepID=U5N767_9BURK|nr:multifunctional CCA addition/repair protein [Candidatus Symbiobacter mobilis]AGX87150.1 tRNA nucleotidyltransferase [Candidatus Symbiobacter mobilis CR]